MRHTKAAHQTNNSNYHSQIMRYAYYLVYLQEEKHKTQPPAILNHIAQILIIGADKTDNDTRQRVFRVPPKTQHSLV